MQLASLRDFFNYGAWANACVWDTAADLKDEQLDRAFEMGEGSLRKTLAHVYGAERAWYERCEGPIAEPLTTRAIVVFSPHGRIAHAPFRPIIIHRYLRGVDENG